MKSSYLSDNIKSILAVIVIIMGLSYFYMCSIRNIKPDPQILIAIVGSVGTVLGYFFGSAATKNQSVPVTGDNTTVNVSPDKTDKTDTAQGS